MTLQLLPDVGWSRVKEFQHICHGGLMKQFCFLPVGRLAGLMLLSSLLVTQQGCTSSANAFVDSEISISPQGATSDIEVESEPGGMMCVTENGERFCVPKVEVEED